MDQSLPCWAFDGIQGISIFFITLFHYGDSGKLVYETLGH